MGRHLHPERSPRAGPASRSSSAGCAQHERGEESGVHEPDKAACRGAKSDQREAPELHQLAQRGAQRERIGPGAEVAQVRRRRAPPRGSLKVNAARRARTMPGAPATRKAMRQP